MNNPSLAIGLMAVFAKEHPDICTKARIDKGVKDGMLEKLFMFTINTSKGEVRCMITMKHFDDFKCKEVEPFTSDINKYKGSNPFVTLYRAFVDENYEEQSLL